MNKVRKGVTQVQCRQGERDAANLQIAGRNAARMLFLGSFSCLFLSSFPHTRSSLVRGTGQPNLEIPWHRFAPSLVTRFSLFNIRFTRA